MTRHVTIAVSLLVLACALGASAGPDPAPPQPKPAPPLARWVDLQNATLNTRYRFIDNSAGVITTNQIQHRESLRARLKFDAPGRYALNLGDVYGRPIHERLEQHGHRAGRLAGPARRAAPVLRGSANHRSRSAVRKHVHLKGESTEITTYDDDGYVIGERVSVRRPRSCSSTRCRRRSATSRATSDGDRRQQARQVPQRPSELRALPRRQEDSGTRAGISADFTSVDGARTWRAATNVNTKELRAVDSILFENYWRTNNNAGVRLCGDGDQGRHAEARPQRGLCQHRSVLRRPQLRPLSHRQPRVRHGDVHHLAAFHRVGVHHAGRWATTSPLLQRTLSNLIFTYNALPDLRRTGLF